MRCKVQVRFGEERLGDSRLCPVSYSTPHEDRVLVSYGHNRRLQPIYRWLGDLYILPEGSIIIFQDFDRG
jgi:hypothetical protein